MFEDSKYHKLIDVTTKAQALGQMRNELGIPRMVIMGEQSYGKSRSFQSITGLPSPSGSGMCTRFAIQVTLLRNEKQPGDRLSATIDGEETFNSAHQDLPVEAFQDIIEHTKTVLQIDDTNRISEKVLKLTLSGPTQIPLTIVDLPGLIFTTGKNHDRNLIDTIFEINRRYIDDENTIILVVTPANLDVLSSKALGFASEYDPDGKRTIPIVTKPDLADYEQAQRWVKTIRNEGDKDMELGYLVLCNIGDNSQPLDQAKAQEAQVLRSAPWNTVASERKGRAAVRMFLVNLLYRRLSGKVLDIIREISVKIDDIKRKQEAMGIPIETPEAASEQLKEPIMKITKEILDYLNADYDGDHLSNFKDEPVSSQHRNHHFLNAELMHLYYEYYDAMMEMCGRLSNNDILPLAKKYKPRDPPGLVPSVISKSIIRGHYLNDWKNITYKHVQTFQELFNTALTSFIMKKATSPSRELFVSIFDQFFKQKVELLKATIEQTFTDESNPLILSRRFSDNLEKNRIRINHSSIIPDKPIREVNKGTVKTPPPLPYSTPDRSQTGSPEPQHPSQNNGTEVAEPSQRGGISQDPSQRIQRSQEYSWSDQHIALELAPFLNSYIPEVCERIVHTVVNQTIERHLIREITDYLLMLQKASSEMLTLHMLETQERQSYRKTLDGKLTAYRNLLSELHELRKDSFDVDLQ
ncbi:MAG: P-loop containing nucleoside triphosphate hydrolase protein [Linnemannia gamsii]|nr:MAG: P-loop containing nucleoside triphosphate hydrolase protein [Linnemannia gamsii]